MVNSSVLGDWFWSLGCALVSSLSPLLNEFRAGFRSVLPMHGQMRVQIRQPSLFQLAIQTRQKSLSVDRGCVKNEVQLGLLTLTLTGPTVFYRNRNILAFDFTRLQLQLAGQVMYAGMIRGGAARDAAFYDLSLKEQAFFNFFWCDPQGIAARGKGGGLALWRRENTP
jgi:hypothetical protein